MEENNVATAPSAELSDAQIDSLVDGTPEGPKTISETPSDVVKPPEPAEEYSFKYKGQQIKADKDRILKWASQGYDYSQKMGEWNKTRQELDEIRKQHADLEQYKQIHDYAQANPKWLEHLQQTWKSKDVQSLDLNDPAQAKIAELNAKLSNVEKFMQESRNKEISQSREMQDKNLATEVNSIRTQYKDLNWNTVDESGMNLEARVLAYAVDNGINNFKTAFLAMNHDNIVKLEKDKALEAANKSTQANTRNGLLSKSSTPWKSVSQAQNVKSKSYDQLAKEALEEFSH